MTAHTSRGFVLPMALFAIALVSLAVTSMMEASWARARQIRLNQTQTAADQITDSAVARVSFLLASSPLTPRALELDRGARFQDGRTAQTYSLILDGRAYEIADAMGGRARVTIALQDEAGLVNLNGDGEAVVARLLTGTGVSGASASRLAAHLSDYIDADDLDRLNGADGRAYERAGLIARNRALDAPLQAFSALGWTDALDYRQAQMFLNAAAARAPRSAFNPNTAGIEVLQSVLDVKASDAMRLRAIREKQLLLSAQEVLALSGSPRTDLHMRAFPSRSMRLIVTVFPTASQESYVYASRISIAQQDADGPIEVTRLERPVRVRLREQARRQRDDPVAVLPDVFHDFAARNR